MRKDLPDHPKNVRFADLLQICTKYFGDPRIRGSHHIFKTPWQGDPRINIQKDGNMAKEYQVKAVMRAIERLKAEKGGPAGNDEARGKKYGK
jgi:CRP-like cAMP-binding protein